MKEWIKAFIALGPLVLALWIFMVFVTNLKVATIVIIISVAIAATVVGWWYYVLEKLDK